MSPCRIPFFKLLAFPFRPSSPLVLCCYLLSELTLPTLRILLTNLFNMYTPFGRNTVACVRFLSAPNFLYCELCHLVSVPLPVGKGCRDQSGQTASQPEKHQLDHRKVDSSPRRPTPISSSAPRCLNMEPYGRLLDKSFDPRCFFQDRMLGWVGFIHILQKQWQYAEIVNLGGELFRLWRVDFDPGGKGFVFLFSFLVYMVDGFQV